MPNVCILGAGTVGLSAAFKLLENTDDDSLKVTIMSESFLHQTTSFNSGGLWEPYQILGTPDELVNHWGKIAFDYFLELYYSKSAARAGVQLMTAYSLLTQTEYDRRIIPSWSNIVFNFTELHSEDLRQMRLPARFAGGFSFVTLVVDQKYYMQYLTDLLLQLGVNFEQKKIESLEELAPRNFAAIVNCTGLGAAALLDDAEMYPIQGQVLRLRAPWMKCIWFWEKSYIIPGVDTVVVGGTANKGNWSTAPSQAETARILRDASELFPALRDAPLESVWVGLRPGRTPLRLELEMVDLSSSKSLPTSPVPVVHCYGHGGSGITLAMGCAEEVVRELLLPALKQTGFRKRLISKL